MILPDGSPVAPRYRIRALPHASAVRLMVWIGYVVGAVCFTAWDQFAR